MPCLSNKGLCAAGSSRVNAQAKTVTKANLNPPRAGEPYVDSALPHGLCGSFPFEDSLLFKAHSPAPFQVLMPAQRHRVATHRVAKRDEKKRYRTTNRINEGETGTKTPDSMTRERQVDKLRDGRREEERLQERARRAPTTSRSRRRAVSPRRPNRHARPTGSGTVRGPGRRTCRPWP